RADRARARPARVLPAQPGTRAQPGDDRAARVGRQLRHLHERHRRLRELPAPQDRRRVRAQAPPHGARGRIRAARAGAVAGVAPAPEPAGPAHPVVHRSARRAARAARGGGARPARSPAAAHRPPLARRVPESRRASARRADLGDALAALIGPSLAERFYQLLDPLGRPDPRLAPRPRLDLPLGADTLRNAEHGEETYETVRLPGAT